MKLFLTLSLLILLAASQANTPSVYFGIFVPSTGTITISSSWGNNAAAVNMIYDVGGLNSAVSLVRNGGVSIAVTSTGKRLIKFIFGNPIPNSLAISLTMPNGDTYTLTTSIMNNYEQAYQTTVSACETNYATVY